MDLSPVQQIQNRQRVNAGTTDTNRPVEVRPRDPAGCSNFSNLLSREDRIAFMDVDDRQVCEQRKQPQSVIDHDRIAATKSPRREVGHDAALELAADAMGAQHLGDDQELRRSVGRAFGDRGIRRRRGRRGCLCGWRRL